MRIVVDSGTYIDWLKRRVDMIPLLMPHLLSDELLICGIIRFEVLRGVVQSGQRSRMDELFSLAIEVPLTPEFWDGAWELAWKLDRKGVVLPLSDVCIAHLALSHEAQVISNDHHFTRIPGLKLSRSLPIHSGKK